MWDLASVKSSPMGRGQVPTCGAKVAGKLWVCHTEGKQLTITTYD
jgi:hypothetical protein